jgi:DNA-binding response OmpR family regulator
MLKRNKETRSVLIAEDDEISLKILERYLGRWGYQAYKAKDGQTALEVLRSNPISILLTDWHMPEMSGVDLIRKIRDQIQDRYIYAILLTARTERVDFLHAMEAGADDYLTKPIDSEMLAARLKVAFRIVNLEKDIQQLQGILPICMHCHRIRKDDVAWQKLESFIEDKSAAQFSHGLCPECLQKHYLDNEEPGKEEGE